MKYSNDSVYDFILTKISFSPETEPNDEVISAIRALCENEAARHEKELLSKVIDQRFVWILKNTPSPHKTSGNDNELLEICWKWLRDQHVSDNATTLIVSQLESTVATIVRSYGMEYSDNTRNEYLSIIYEVCSVHMPEYCAAKGKPITFLTPHVRGELFKQLITDRDKTKHYALRQRDIKNAKAAIFDETGNANPSHVEIVDHINKHPEDYVPITIKIVENVEAHNFVTVDIDEQIVSTEDSPEKTILKKELSNELLHMFDDQSAVLQKLWKLHLAYFAEHESKEHMPSLQYLKNAYNRLSDDEISDDRLRMELSKMQRIVREKSKLNRETKANNKSEIHAKSSSINYFNANLDVIDEMDRDIYESIMSEIEEY